MGNSIVWPTRLYEVLIKCLVYVLLFVGGDTELKRLFSKLDKMVEGGVVRGDNVEFTECWNTVWKTPYIMRLALSAGIGGLLFGYDTGKLYRTLGIFFILHCKV